MKPRRDPHGRAKKKMHGGTQQTGSDEGDRGLWMNVNKTQVQKKIKNQSRPNTTKDS